MDANLKCEETDQLENVKLQTLLKATVGHVEKKVLSQVASSETAHIGRDRGEATSRAVVALTEPLAAKSSLLQRLAALGLEFTNQEEEIRALHEREYYEDTEARALVKKIVSEIPTAASHFNKIADVESAGTENADGGDANQDAGTSQAETDQDGWEYEESIDAPAQHFTPRTVEQVWRWTIGDEHFWLFRVRDPIGGASTRYWFLLRGTKDRDELVDFFYMLYPRNLAEEIKGESDSIAETWLWPEDAENVRLIDERYLLCSGTWGGYGLEEGWVLLYDLSDRKVLLFKDDIENPGLVEGFHLHRPSRTVVQVNNNGQVYGYTFGSGAIAFRGYELDDEVILYNDQGYYDATPEGAHFVFLKFPGVPGYHAFSQFATLHRPEVLKAILSGDGAKIDAPNLGAPPALTISDDIRETGKGRTAVITATVFSQGGAKAVRLFEDGNYIKEVALENNGAGTASTKAELPLLPETRWIAAVAVGDGGELSVPQVIQAPAEKKAKAVGRLHVIAVGTDNYSDAGLTLQRCRAYPACARQGRRKRLCGRGQDGREILWCC
jgi:hypothetical protein